MSKNDLKKVLCRVLPYLALAKDGFAECPLSQHSANNLFAFFLEMDLPSAGSRALDKPDPALGKSSKTYLKRCFPDSHTAHAHTPVHYRPPACAAAACPPALPPPVPARPPLWASLVRVLHGSALKRIGLVWVPHLQQFGPNLVWIAPI